MPDRMINASKLMKRLERMGELFTLSTIRKVVESEVGLAKRAKGEKKDDKA